jgi:hypothetical protein
VVALVPVTLLHDTGLGLAYLALFGVGVTAGMMVFAVVAAVAIRRAAGDSWYGAAGRPRARESAVSG